MVFPCTSHAGDAPGRPCEHASDSATVRDAVDKVASGETCLDWCRCPPQLFHVGLLDEQ